jgi:hypothetical protein
MSGFFCPRLTNLNLDIDLNEVFGEWVDLHQAWIDRTREAAELGDETDVALGHGL